MERDLEQKLEVGSTESVGKPEHPWDTLVRTWFPLIKGWGALLFASLSAATILLMLVAGLKFIAWTMTGDEKFRMHPSSNPTSPSSPPTPAASAIAGVPISSPTQTPSADSSPSPALSLNMSLVIPVVGIKPEQLLDTYENARGEGRSHNAIDIMAPKGTPVVAAADGSVARLFTSDKGGVTLYQLSQDEKLVYYYAHLDHYAGGVKEGKQLRQGETIAYVGDTGNAGPGSYHLHFAIWTITDPKRIWDGENINPYPLLRSAQ